MPSFIDRASAALSISGVGLCDFFLLIGSLMSSAAMRPDNAARSI